MAPDDTPEVVTYRVDRLEDRMDTFEGALKENTEATRDIRDLLRTGQEIREKRVKRWKWGIGAALTLITATQPIIYRALGL